MVTSATKGRDLNIRNTGHSRYVDFMYLYTDLCRSDFSFPTFFLYIFMHFNSVYVENG